MERFDDLEEFCGRVNGEYTEAGGGPGGYNVFKYHWTDEKCTFNFGRQEYTLDFGDDQSKMIMDINGSKTQSSIDGEFGIEFYDLAPDQVLVAPKEQLEDGYEMWSEYSDGVFLTE